MERKSRRLWIVLVIVLVAGVCTLIGSAGAESGGKLRTSIPIPAMKREVMFTGPQSGQTCVNYEWTIAKNGFCEEGYYYNYSIAIDDGSHPGGEADIMYETAKTAVDSFSTSFSYTFYEPGEYWLYAEKYVYLGSEKYEWIDWVYYRIVITEGDGENPLMTAVATAAAACQRETDFLTVEAINDYICDLVEYDHTYLRHSPESALLDGTGVCTSYARSFKLIADACGLQSRRVTGDAGGGHAWNLVMMDGKWYQMDLTWNDTGGNRHLYFGLTDTLISHDHTDMYIVGGDSIVCDSMDNNWYVRSNDWKTTIGRSTYTNISNLVQSGTAVEDVLLEKIYNTATGGSYVPLYSQGEKVDKFWLYGNLLAYLYSQEIWDGPNNTQMQGQFTYNFDNSTLSATLSEYVDEPAANVTGEVIPNDGKWNLLISGDGKMRDYAAVADVPWSADVAGKTIDRVVLSEGLTHIGSNAFAMLNDGVRIDFLQTAKPTVAEDAFGNIQAVCRYYSTDSSWSGTTSTTNVTWIDLPASMANNDAPLELRYRVNSATSAGEWAIGPRTNSYNNNTAIRADQAKEITYNDRWVVFEAIPTTSVTTAATDKAVYEGLDAPTVLLFMEGTDGTYTIDFTGKPANLRWVESRSRNPLNLTITAPAGNVLEEMVICDGGQITYTGNVDQVTLKTTQWQTPEITINGDVSELTYYDAASDSPFKGTLTVNGTIAHGTVHSQTSLFVPGISATNEPVEFRNIAAYTIENIQQTTPVITLIEVTGEDEETHQESRLSIGNETVQPTVLSLDKFRISYTFLPDRVAFNLDPKSDAGLGNYSAKISDIRAADYNPGFTTADIIQGPDTVVYVHDTGTGESDPTIELGDASAGGMQAGIRTMYLQNCKVKANWPVDQIMIWQQSYKNGPVILEINSQVNDMGMFLNQGGGLISIGSKGSLKGGYVNRGIRGNRYFGAVNAGGIVAENGTLCQMSWKQGETTKALLASDAIVTAAAGNQVASGQFASMDVADATLAQLSTDEQRALNDYLTDQELDADHVISVFDVSVNTYERDATNDNLTQKETLSELANPISITIANNAGETAKVVRLHEGTSGSIQADELENQSEAEGVYEFSTKWFSKYALVAEEIPLTEEELTTGKSQLTWYTGLKSGWFDEPGLYDIGGIGYFGIPYSEQIAENTPVWTLTLLNGTDCFELYGYNDDQRTRELRPKTENLTSGTSSQYEVSCQVGNTIYRATTTITIAQAEGIPTGIQLQKASFNPETAAIDSTWTDVGNETDLVSGGAIAIRALYIGNGLGDIKDQVLDCMYYGGENSFIDTPYRWNYQDANGKILIDNNVQPILAVSTGMSTVEFGIMISGTNLQYYAKTDIYVNRDQVMSFTAPVITIGTGKTQYYEGEAFTISCPWITGAESVDIIIWKENDDAITTYSIWEEETETCILPVNNIDPYEDRRLTAGQYHVQIIPRAAGYKPALYNKAFEIISLPDFTTFEIPEETTEIGAEAFARIAAKNVRIPDECSTIGANAFSGSQLENIFIPASVTSIGDNAFPTGTTVFMTQENDIAAWLRTQQYTVIILPAGIGIRE